MGPVERCVSQQRLDVEGKTESTVIAAGEAKATTLLGGTASQPDAQISLAPQRAIAAGTP